MPFVLLLVMLLPVALLLVALLLVGLLLVALLAVLDGLAALPVVVARDGQQTCPMPLIGEKQEGHKKRNSEYRGWGGRG